MIVWHHYYYYFFHRFKENDAFVGFQKDTPASVVFQATNMLRSAHTALERGEDVRMGQWADLWEWSQCDPDELRKEENGEDSAWKNAVSVHT